MNYDSPGGHPRDLYMPPCATCGHPIEVHKHYDKGAPRRACSHGGACPCRLYREGDPATWPPLHDLPQELPTMTNEPQPITADLDKLDEAVDIVGHIPEPILDYLEWVLLHQANSLAAQELRDVLKAITAP